MTAADRDTGDGERQRAGGRGSRGDGERQRAGGRGSRGDGERQRAGGWGSRRWIVLAAVVALCVVAVIAVARDRRPVDIAVVDPPAASLGELLSRADLVVVGRIVQVAPGRVLSDPGDPDRAVRTQLAQLEVDEVTRGSGAARLVLEEVAALADGTPATVAGLEASQVGDAGLYLLVHGDDGRVGLVGPQGRYLLVADDPDRLRAPPGGDPLARRLADLGPRRLRRAVLGAPSR